MSIESTPNFHTLETLSLREQVLVKSASIIDEGATSEKHLHGKLFSADWINPADGVNFHLDALGERLNPEETNFIYNLVGYNPSTELTMCDFSYNTFTQRIYKRGEKGSYKRCKSSEIDDLLINLYSAPSSLTTAENATFISLMQENDIRDMRFGTQFKRMLARRVFEQKQ